MTSCILNSPSKRLLEICQLLSRPPYAQSDILCLVDVERSKICLEHKNWGLLATLEVSALPASQSSLTMHLPEYPDRREAKEYRTALLLKLEPKHPEDHRLVGTELEEQRLLVCLANELDQVRSKQRDAAMQWFLQGLRIWGVKSLDQPSKGETQRGYRNQTGQIEHPKCTFDFMTQGTPAEFAVMAYASFGVGCTVLSPGTQRELLEVPSDINPVAVQYRKDDGFLNLLVHKLPNGNSLIKATVSANECGWGLWNALRDEMERLGWFSISPLENVSPSTTTEPQQKNIPEFTVQKLDIEHLPPEGEHRNELPQVWLTIPDRGWDRECIRLWHRGLTSKDIGRRLEKTDKTILNRLNQLRNEFGEQAVPYRHATYRSG
ncbi:MAG: hypothetical protein A2X26_01410 [Chloroflexi bacterium GWC2_49_37]|nr:MAG: hypothetical protein A2X26_01410 [Chloroflexi bacterium GWC2_49_37]